MYIVHIIITIHIQVLYTAKKFPTQWIMGLPRIYVLHSTQQKK